MAGITTEYKVGAQCVEEKNGELYIGKYEEKIVTFVSEPRSFYSIGIILIHVQEGPARELVEFLKRNNPQFTIPMWIDGESIKVSCRSYTLKNHAFASAEFVRVIEV